MIRFSVFMTALICMLSLASCEKEIRDITGEDTFQVELPTSSSQTIVKPVAEDQQYVAANETVEMMASDSEVYAPIHNGNLLETIIEPDDHFFIVDQSGNPVNNVTINIVEDGGGHSYSCYTGTGNTCDIQGIAVPLVYEFSAYQNGNHLPLASVTVVGSQITVVVQ